VTNVLATGSLAHCAAGHCVGHCVWGVKLQFAAVTSLNSVTLY